MGALEITLLHLKPGTEAAQDSLLENLRSVRAQLNTNSRFYLDRGRPTSIFIFGLWPTMEAHKAFLASPECGRILGPQEAQTEFAWGLHVADVSTMDDLPLDSKIMYLHLLEVQEAEEVALDGALSHVLHKFERMVGDAGNPVVCKNALDAAPGNVGRCVIHGNEELLEMLADVGRMCSDTAYSVWQLEDLEKI
ncbi:uncharacterized protein PV09_03045 [Verruconis gallopava]|uniref:ABM domain-containing protein n=1 Tax=Verruconis gallopava TaxID=253628 RepID=A0A0D1XSZ0_9PEZI|nr:uncharacterized protein PV09_03045 [Verruconis gallopava]KIW05841.1 hypothetical protein PV09_03045 [Verruconis gallopava]